MSRLLPDWINAYMKFTENTEPARQFQLWTGLSLIASALRKKVKLELGRLSIYPNMYVVFVAEPGVARKSQAIDFGMPFLENVPEIIKSADATTPQAIMDDLEKCAGQEEVMPDGSTLHHSSLSIVSREFESFLGQKKENSKMLTLLTDLFDSKELPWVYRTKHSGSNKIPSPFLNMLAATTPESLASCLPSTAIGGGLTSRMIFVYAEKRSKKCAIPIKTEEVLALEDALTKDLWKIARMVGTYKFDDEAREKWVSWYNEYEELDINRICKDPSFNGWYSRKPTYILKVSQICAASVSDEFIMKWEYIERATQLVESIESGMGYVFRAIGKSVVASEVDMVTKLIRTHRKIKEEYLLSLIWRDIDASKFDIVINTILKQGIAKRDYAKDGIYYYWNETKYNENISGYKLFTNN